MAKVKIQGNASGTGVLTVTAPNTSTDRTITLPDSTGTILDENSSLPAANLTGTVADARISALTASKLTGALPAISGASLTNLPSSISAGQIVQIVTSASTGGSNDNGNITWRDTHVTATITPQYSNSKILLFSRIYIYGNNTSGEMYFGLDYRRNISGGTDTTNISGETAQSVAQHRSIGNGELADIYNHNAIDTPSTTSATTYTLRIGGQGSANTIWGWQGMEDTLVIMEVKV